jgi:predicted nucleic acid-binding protein
MRSPSPPWPCGAPIAAHAISTGSILVSRNIVDFRDIPNLPIEDWSIGS